MKKGIYCAIALLMLSVNLYSSQDLPQGIYKVREFQVNSIGDTNYQYPIVATNANDDIYITWAYRSYEINHAKFNSSGDLLIPQEQLRNDLYGDCFYPYVCFNENDDYLIAWLDGRNDYPGRVWEIYGVFFSANDEKQLDNFLISEAVTRESIALR
ncbi:MAG: hypothetical protein ACE5OP_13870 [Candidatus Glassbacteria bacterium]